MRGLPRRHPRKAIRQGGDHALRGMPQQHEVETVSFRPRDDSVFAARRTPGCTLRRVSQVDEGGGGQNGSFLQTDTQGVRGLPRGYESGAPIEAWVLAAKANFAVRQIAAHPEVVQPSINAR